MLKSHQKGDLTPAETKVDYLAFAKVLPRFFTKKEMDSSDSALRMGALYLYNRVQRMKVCSLHLRGLVSRNYLNGRIPERWFCFKFALSLLLPRKGKHSPERVNPPSRLNNTEEISSIRHTSVHEMFRARPNVFTVFTILSLSSAIKVATLGSETAVSLFRNPSTSC